MRSYLALWAVEHRLDLNNPAMTFSRLLPLEDANILEVVETKHFEKQLRRQHPAVQGDWILKKNEIKIALPSPPRFEKLRDKEPAIWSLRLRDGHRVHLQPPDAGTAAWRAVAIGNHKEMGHG